MVKTGGQRRQFPSNFPPWKTVHEHFRVWRDSGVWERIVSSYANRTLKAGGRNATSTVAIIDSQSAETTLKGSGAVTSQAKRSKDASGTSR
jgi:putative transposase